MSTQPGLFFAYAKYVRTKLHIFSQRSLVFADIFIYFIYQLQVNDDVIWRYLITFASRKVADQWWRAVTDSVANGYSRFSTITRVSPQFYTHNPYVEAGSIFETVNDEKVAKKLLGKVLFTLLVDRDGRTPSVAPVLNYTDHVSGNRYVLYNPTCPREKSFG